MRGDGEHNRFYVQVSDGEVPTNFFCSKTGCIQFVPLKAKKRGEVGVRHFLEYMVDENQIASHNLLLFDGKSAFRTNPSLEILNDLGVTYLVFPAALHALLDPCDNNFHSAFKSYYYGEISRLSIANLTHIKKLELAALSYFQVTNESVVNMFLHCGIIGTESPEKVVQNLVNETNCVSLQKQEIFEKQLAIFLIWASENKYTDFIPDFPKRLA